MQKYSPSFDKIRPIQHNCFWQHHFRFSIIPCEMIETTHQWCTKYIRQIFAMYTSLSLFKWKRNNVKEIEIRLLQNPDNSYYMEMTIFMWYELKKKKTFQDYFKNHSKNHLSLALNQKHKASWKHKTYFWADCWYMYYGMSNY